MIRRGTVRIVVLVGLLLAIVAGGARAQQPSTAPSMPASPLKVDVVLSRFEADKKVSSLPFTLWLSVMPPSSTSASNQPGPSASASIRMGVDVPVGTTTASTTRQDTLNATSVTTPPSTKPEYRNIGTQVDASVQQFVDGRYSVRVNVNDSSIYTTAKTGPAVPRFVNPLAFRSFTFGNTLTMKPGETLEFAMGTDKISGETLRVNVTISVK